MLHEQVAIPGSDLNLVYLSSRAAGYKPILKVLLTQDRLPFGLMKVHLMVAVMGRQFQKSFPAFPDLSYTFIWDKTDAYNQKVFGLAEAVGELLLRGRRLQALRKPHFPPLETSAHLPRGTEPWLNFAKFILV